MRSASFLPLAIAALLTSACSASTTIADDDGAGGSGSSTSKTTGALTTGSQTTGTASTGSGSGFGACNGPGQCILLTPGCCGSCGQPTLAELEPVNESQAQAFFDETCPEPEPCPGCPGAQPDPNLYAYCDGVQCQEADLRKTDLAACDSPGDCVLRSGTGCCTCNGGGGWVAINSMQQGALVALVCDPMEACADCEPIPPAELIATCVDGQCVVETLQPG